MCWKDKGMKKKKLDKKTMNAINQTYYKALTGILTIGPKDLETAPSGVDYKMIVYRIREKAQMTLDFVRDQEYVEPTEKEKTNKKNSRENG